MRLRAELNLATISSVGPPGERRPTTRGGSHPYRDRLPHRRRAGTARIPSRGSWILDGGDCLVPLVAGAVPTPRCGVGTVRRGGLAQIAAHLLVLLLRQLAPGVALAENGLSAVPVRVIRGRIRAGQPSAADEPDHEHTAATTSSGPATIIPGPIIMPPPRRPISRSARTTPTTMTTVRSERKRFRARLASPSPRCSASIGGSIGVRSSWAVADV